MAHRGNSNRSLHWPPRKSGEVSFNVCPEISLPPGKWCTLGNAQGEYGGTVIPADNLFLVGSKWHFFIHAENSSSHLASDKGKQQMQSSPVNDASFMEKHEGWDNFCSIEPGPIFVKAPRFLDVEHQIPTVDKLHYKEQAILHTGKNNKHERH